MRTLIVVDCETPFGVGAPSVGDMREFGAVDVNALPERRTETFHGQDCSQDTFTRFREWLEQRSRSCSYRTIPRTNFQWINFCFWRYFRMNPFGHSGRRIAEFYAGLVGDFARRRTGGVSAERSTIIIRFTTRSGMPSLSLGADSPVRGRTLNTH